MLRKLRWLRVYASPRSTLFSVRYKIFAVVSAVAYMCNDLAVGQELFADDPVRVTCERPASFIWAASNAEELAKEGAEGIGQQERPGVRQPNEWISGGEILSGAGCQHTRDLDHVHTLPF